MLARWGANTASTGPPRRGAPRYVRAMPPDDGLLEELARRFRHLAGSAEARAPLYASMGRAIAGFPEVVRLFAEATPPEQQNPALLLAALHDQVLAEPGCELAAWFPTVASDPRVDRVDDALRRHCSEHADVLRATLAGRRTQTNEIGRCGLLVPALARLGDTGAIALVDIGTSAGLNLRLDHYHYVYEPGGEVGAGPVTLTTGTRGAVPVPDRLPHLAARIGVDQAPIDVRDPRATRWLQACVWPDQADRFHRLAAALEVAREVPVEVRTGDALAELGGAVAAAGERGRPVVTTTWVLSYLPRERRVAFVGLLDRIGSTTDLSWIFAESPAQAEGLPYPDRLGGEHVTALGLVTWRGGRRRVEHLGRAHPHGYWLHWEAGR